MAQPTQIFQVTYTIFGQPYTEDFEAVSALGAVGAATDKLGAHVALGHPVAIVSTKLAPTQKGH